MDFRECYVGARVVYNKNGMTKRLLGKSGTITSIHHGDCFGAEIRVLFDEEVRDFGTYATNLDLIAESPPNISFSFDNLLMEDFL